MVPSPVVARSRHRAMSDFESAFRGKAEDMVAASISPLTLSGSRWVQFGRPALAGIAAVRWIGCLAGHYLGARRRNRFHLAKYRYPLTRGRLGRSNRLVASRVCPTLEMLPNISRAG